jgi:predicted PurR-regulated permease PerM
VEDKAFLLRLAGVSAAFLLIVWPFYGAVFWATVLAVLFTPLYRRTLRWMRHRPTIAALVTVLLVVSIVILPLTAIGALLAQEAASTYAPIQAGELNFGRYFEQMLEALPTWMVNLLHASRLIDPGAMRERLSGSLLRISELVAGQALAIGQNTLDFVVSLAIMLYLLFFLLRDGERLSARIKAAIPLRAEQMRDVLDTFGVVIRATIKGNVLIALVQGVLGGLMFWFLNIHAAALWGVVMGVLSLLPAVGTALVWVPVAIYLLLTGATWQGIVLIAYGALVIGSVDNVLRPIVVGKDTKMPDYVVLVSTLGGLAVFGPNGFVIGPVIPRCSSPPGRVSRRRDRPRNTSRAGPGVTRHRPPRSRRSSGAEITSGSTAGRFEQAPDQPGQRHGGRAPEGDARASFRRRGAPQSSGECTEEDEEHEGRRGDRRHERGERQQQHEQHRRGGTERKRGCRRQRRLDGACSRHRRQADLVAGMGGERIMGGELPGHLRRERP